MALALGTTEPLPIGPALSGPHAQLTQERRGDAQMPLRRSLVPGARGEPAEIEMTARDEGSHPELLRGGQRPAEVLLRAHGIRWNATGRDLTKEAQSVRPVGPVGVPLGQHEGPLGGIHRVIGAASTSGRIQGRTTSP